MQKSCEDLKQGTNLLLESKTFQKCLSFVHPSRHQAEFTGAFGAKVASFAKTFLTMT